MTTKNLDDLRAALFDTLDQVRSGELDIARALAVNDLAKTLTDTARAEVGYLRATGGGESAFIGTAAPMMKAVAQPLPKGIVGVRRHLLKD